MTNHDKASSLASFCLLSGFLLLTGCAGGGGGSPGLTDNAAFRLGTTRTFQESVVVERRQDQEFKNMSAFGLSGISGPESSTHPLSFSNVDRAYGYGLSGSGTTIAVLDSGFNTQAQFTAGSAFPDLQQKRNAGLLEFQGVLTSGSNGHGNYVASIAAAPYDSALGANFYQTATGVSYPETGTTAVFNHGIAGTAPNAKLLLTDYNHFIGPEGWAQAADHARAARAKVQNNSWALCAPNGSCLGPDPSEIRTALLNETFPGYPGSADPQAALNWLVSQTDTGTTSQWARYVQSLQQFQSTGVVVFALQNRLADTSPSIVAALPQLFPDLKAAWLTVGNMDSNYSLKSAACGVTAEYCLVTDGHEITGAGLDLQFYVRGSGTSSAAPQVSGMIALLAEAFPTLTPAQLSQRLLASANNRFASFVVAGSTHFGGGVSHSYSNTHGHGVPDMQAALQPITSSTVPQSFVLLNSTTGQISSVSLSQTKLSAGIAFGDAFAKGLQHTKALSFDALGAGFDTPLRSFTAPFVPSIRGLHPSVHRRSTYGQSHAEPESLRLLPNRPQFASEKLLAPGVTVHMDGTLRDMSAGRATHSPANRMMLGFDPVDRALPFVEQAQGLGLSFQVSHGLSTSFFINPQASYASNPSSDYTKLRQSALAGISLAGTLLVPDSFGHADWLLGIQREEGSFRNSRGYGALQVGPQTESIFFSPRYWLQTSQDTTLEFGLSLGVSRTDIAPNHASMIDSLSAYITSGFYGELRSENWPQTGDLSFVRVWQPERSESGEATLRFPAYSASRQAIVFSHESVSLVPSARELNLSLGHEKVLGKDQTLGFLYNFKKNPGHSNATPASQSLTLTWHRLF